MQTSEQKDPSSRNGKLVPGVHLFLSRYNDLVSRYNDLVSPLNDLVKSL